MNKDEDVINMVTELHYGFDKYKPLLSPDRIAYACLNYGIALAFELCEDHDTAEAEARGMFESILQGTKTFHRETTNGETK